MKKIYVTLIVIILAFLVLGCAGSKSGNSDISSDNSQQAQTQAVEQPAEPLTILDSTITHDEITGYAVSGTARANKDLSYAEVTSKCYDSNGAVIGSYLTNMQNLKKGETWNFKILGPFDNSVKVSNYTVSNGNSF